ncbi:hypothetical protein KHC33_01250 [Methanospirillum sp. J.3.6.1-F.2.7.3]|uniref:Uncharacterized protein n=1 Tax=Methanospirillum purgamenti TaxID=2834276 RepID=A0A8E7EK08_9EURY|nr:MULTISPECIES: hypothetical protein [Methanospirillum]MDX8551795.1 hypothetical protein [Methanospirillum hungatei]QVV89191.1 hypothetical protein KHC33_01250 [Methanospirillum sp. J.3.6.1-F.2.7.3]
MNARSDFIVLLDICSGARLLSGLQILLSLTTYLSVHLEDPSIECSPWNDLLFNLIVPRHLAKHYYRTIRLPLRTPAHHLEEKSRYFIIRMIPEPLVVKRDIDP